MSLDTYHIEVAMPTTSTDSTQLHYDLMVSAMIPCIGFNSAQVPHGSSRLLSLSLIIQRRIVDHGSTERLVLGGFSARFG